MNSAAAKILEIQNNAKYDESGGGSMTLKEMEARKRLRKLVTSRTESSS
jgi:hypothetical protein